MPSIKPRGPHRLLRNGRLRGLPLDQAKDRMLLRRAGVDTLRGLPEGWAETCLERWTAEVVKVRALLDHTERPET